MVSAKLRGRDMEIEREERDRETRGEIHKMDNRYEPQNFRLYDCMIRLYDIRLELQREKLKGRTGIRALKYEKRLRKGKGNDVAWRCEE